MATEQPNALIQQVEQTAAYAGVICHGHDIPGVPSCGKVVLTYAEYMAQLARPDRGWCCPACHASADFDDERFEELHPDPEE